MMKAFFLSLLALFLLFTPGWGSPKSLVKDIQIERNQEGVLLTVYCQGEISYQVWETKDPPRVILDFEDAKHALPHLNYFHLPPCGIKSIRTSQFKLNPLRVRIALDLEKMLPHRVVDDRHNFQLLFPGADLPHFKPWLASRAERIKRPASEAKPKVKRAVEKRVKPIIPSPQQSGEELPSFAPRRAVHYSSGGRRDPFKPLWQEGELQFGSVPLPDVENLTLVGVLEDSSGFRALLEDPNGYGYILRKGDRVKNGYVAQVTEEKIIFQVVEYGWTRTVLLKMKGKKKSEVGYE